MVSWFLHRHFATMGVSMAPGHTALMRMPRAAYSSAALFVSPSTPCLVACSARPGLPMRPPIEEQLTMAPLPCSRIWRSSYFMQFQTPRRLIAFTRSNSSPPHRRFPRRGLHAGIVECCIQATKCRDSLRDHGCHLSLVGDIARMAIALQPGDQFLYCGNAASSGRPPVPRPLPPPRRLWLSQDPCPRPAP